MREPGLGSLAALFGSSEVEDTGQDSAKLMDLYWNRAELKKAYADAQNEHFRLKDRIKKQEGATARVQQKLDHIEDLLIDPESAFNVVVFYQLRGLAMRCESKLSLFAEQLKLQREKKQHEGLVSTWNTELAQDSAAFEEQLLILRNQVRQTRDQQSALQQHLKSMGGIRRLFKSRSVKAELKELDHQIETAQAEENLILADLDLISKRVPPETSGLDNTSKRSINLMIIAFAQKLYLDFSAQDFVSLVKEASDKSAGAVSYGNRYECTQILQQIQNRIESIEQLSDDAVILRKRAKLIGEKAIFTKEADVVPVPGSVTTVFDIDERGLVRECEVAILRKNYWGITKALSR